MPAILVRLNLPGFSSPEPFRLANAQPSMTGLACAVLEEIGGFTKEELEGVQNNVDSVPLTLLGELCAGQLVELGSDAELEVFLTSAESPRGPAIIEVRPREATARAAGEAARAAGGVQDVHGRAPEETGPNGHCGPPAAPSSERSLAGPPPQRGGAAPQASRPWPPPHGAQAAAAQQQWQQPPHEAPTPQPASTPSASPTPSWQERSRWVQDRAQPSRITKKIGSNRGNSVPALVGQPSSRASTPPSRQQRAWEGDRRDGGADAATDTSTPVGSARSTGPVHVRLYNEKDDRRRRLEEARLRKLEQEEEDIRSAAKRALGRTPSPSRAASPPPQQRLREPQEAPGRYNSTGQLGIRSQTPPRARPPLPEKGFAEGASRNRQAARRGQQRERGAILPPTDTSSVGSERSGQQPGRHSGLDSVASAGTLVEDESLPGDANASVVLNLDDPESLRQAVRAQQQRIEFLENMHQQALRQLRTTREELAQAQQQRFREADKVLQLEQLVSEMQARHFEGDVRWEEWLRRSRAILEGDQ